MDTIEHFSEYVQLFLIGCPVPYTYRARITIAFEVGQFSLDQVSLASNTIHNLEVITTQVRKATQPVSECMSLLCITKRSECIERKGGIT